MTIVSRVAAARQRLRASGITAAEADLDARLLAEHILGWDAARFFTSGTEPEPAGFASQYEAVVDRRAAREPIAYLVGRREFWGLPLEVSPAVLIPRPETELIVEAAIELFPSQTDRITVVDVCTGSGCLAVALAHERAAATIVATDISEEALAVARRNAGLHGFLDRVHFVCGDLLEPIAGSCDLIVSNPPYVAERARPALQPEVRDHEPAVALFSGHDGLDAIRRLIHQAPLRLRAGGYLVCEFGYGQEQEVEDLLSASTELHRVGLRRDLQGIARTAVARRR